MNSSMQFLNPQLLWLLLLGFVPLVLYLFRRKSKKVHVSTLVFFKSLAREHQESAWLRRLKKWLSFVLTILILFLAVFVLSRIIVKQDEGSQFNTVVILLDRSASMEVADEEGESRIDAAKRILKERLKQIPEEIGISLVAYDVRPEVLQPRTLKRRELISRLDDVAVRPMADKTDSAVETARILAGLEPPTEIWHVSDHALADSFRLPENVSVRELNLALPEVSNPGITSFQIRPVPLEYSRYDAFVQVALNHAAVEPVTAKLNVSVGGIPSQFRELDLKPGERISFTFRINGARDQILRLELNSENDDFALDNVVSIPLPDVQPILAAWIRKDETEDPYTRFALSSIQEAGSLELLKGGPDAWPLREEVDAVIFDGWVPEEWPEDIPVIVINPPASSGPVLARQLSSPIPYDAVRVGNEEHPVLFRVSSGRVSLTQTSVFQVTDSLEPLWIAGNEPVLAAGEVNGQRLVVLGFSPGLSENLPLTSSFPILMGNALLWCVDELTDVNRVQLYSTGDLAHVDGESLTWMVTENRQLKKQRYPLKSKIVELDRIGMWETDTGQKGASHILSSVESDIPAQPEMRSNDSDYFSVKRGIAGGLNNWLLGFAIVILLLESWLFHRHSVY